MDLLLISYVVGVGVFVILFVARLRRRPGPQAAGGDAPEHEIIEIDAHPSRPHSPARHPQTAPAEV